MMMVGHLQSLALEILLNGRVVLLRSRKISGLEILGELTEGPGNRVIALRRGGGIGLRQIIL